MKIAIGFFGITRSLKYTINSINNNILEVFKLNKIKYDIFLHCYYLSSYSNKRAKEKINKKNIDNEEYKLLKPKYFKQHKQYKIKKRLNLKSYRTYKDPWNTGYNSVDNFILASYSKYRLTKMIKKHIKEYDYILFMRPDCKYIQKFDIKHFNLVNNNTIVIPNFHLCSKYKINDRFAITNKKTYKIYGKVYKKLLDLSKKNILHSETILGIILKKINNLNIKKIKFIFLRIRINGKICPRDKELIKKYIN